MRAVNSPSGKARRGPTTSMSPSCRPKRFSSSAWNSSSGSATMRSASRVVLGPHDRRALARQRQDRERPGRQEMLLGAAVVIALVRDRGDDRRLVVVPAVRGDAGLLADRRARAVGADQKPRRDRLAVGELHVDARSRALSKPRHRVGAQLDAERFRLVDQRVDQQPVLDHVRERLARLRPRRRRSERSAAPRRRACESVTTMSRIGCASAATASQTSIASNSRRAAAAIAEARGSLRLRDASAGSATVTVKVSPSPWRSAMRQREAGKAAAADHHIGLLRCLIGYC